MIEADIALVIFVFMRFAKAVKLTVEEQVMSRHSLGKLAFVLGSALLSACNENQQNTHPLTGTWELKGYYAPIRVTDPPVSWKSMTATIIVTPESDIYSSEEERYSCSVSNLVSKDFMASLDIDAPCYAKKMSGGDYMYFLRASQDLMLQMNYDGNLATGSLYYKDSYSAFGYFTMKRVSTP